MMANFPWRRQQQTSRPGWQISGQYLETCNCAFLCPCATTATATPTKGHCTFALAYHIEQGYYGATDLSGRDVVVVGNTPGAMADGNWTLGLILDDRASSEQQQALASIFGGQAGGPIADIAPLIGTVAGPETRPIQFQHDTMSSSVSAQGLVDEAATGFPGANASEPRYLDNIPHPVTTRLALAKATRSHVHAFGLEWDDVSGENNAHFAPFSWQGNMPS
jgi:hypothetical protein